MIVHYIVEKKPLLFLFLQAFSIEKILKCHVKDCFKINDKLMIKMLKKVNTLDYERKIKSTFLIYAILKLF